MVVGGVAGEVSCSFDTREGRRGVACTDFFAGDPLDLSNVLVGVLTGEGIRADLDLARGFKT